VPLVLASASPARLGLLQAAGIEPLVVVSGVDESAVSAPTVAATVAELARRKTSAVARRGDLPAASLVIGCDSLLEFDGEALGKPASPDDARQRWERMRGRSGVLHTGHHLVEVETGRTAAETTRTVVHFGRPTDAEIAAYVDSGEPLAVAGAFTLDGRGSPWVERIEGDPSTVIGLSLPALRRLLGHLDRSIVELWTTPRPGPAAAPPR
jgi:septum formation protein